MVLIQWTLMARRTILSQPQEYKRALKLSRCRAHRTFLIILAARPFRWVIITINLRPMGLVSSRPPRRVLVCTNFAHTLQWRPPGVIRRESRRIASWPDSHRVQRYDSRGGRKSNGRSKKAKWCDGNRLRVYSIHCYSTDMSKHCPSHCTWVLGGVKISCDAMNNWL